MNTETPRPTPPPTKAFAHQAARASWLGPVIIFLLFAFAHQVAGQVILELIALVLIVAGDVTSLFRAVRCVSLGRKKGPDE
jgi:hypothetical protein